jgi:hypothetical protein
MNQGTIDGHSQLAYNAWQITVKLLDHCRIAYIEGRIDQGDLDHAEAEERKAYKAYVAYRDLSPS